MGVRKFRSVEEMPGPSRRTPLDPENLRLALGLASLADGLHPLRTPAGVRKFRSWDEALEGRASGLRADREAARRSLERRKRMVAHRAASFEEAEAWDLDFWQQRTPEERLSALVAIRRDVELVEAARGKRSPEEP